MKASAVNRCVCAGFEPAGIRCPGKPEVIHPKPYPTGAPHGALFYIPVSYATAALPFPVLAMQPVLIGRHMDA